MPSGLPTTRDTLSTSHVTDETIAASIDNDQADAINKIQQYMRLYAARVVAASDASAEAKTFAHYTCDGVADDVQLNQALTDLSTPPYGTCFVVGSAFNLASTVVIPNAPVSLVGQGGKATMLKASAGLATSLVRVQGPTAPQQYGVNLQRVAYLGIDGTLATGTEAHNLEITGSVYQGLFEHLHITAAHGHSVYLRASAIVQWINIFGSPTGGTFTLTFNGQTTGAIAYNALASTVQTALRALSGIGTNVTCTSGPLPGTAVVCTFTGALAVSTTPAMTVSASLTGGSTPFMQIWNGERPAYNRIAYCNIENGQRDGIRSGDVSPLGFYAEHNEFLHNSVTFMAGNGIFSTGNNNRIHSNQLDYLDMGVQLVGAENNAVWGNTFDRCATHWAKIDQGGQHTFAFNLFGDRQSGFSAGSKGFYITGNTSGDKFVSNSVLNQFGRTFDTGFTEDAGVGNSGSGYWGPNVYIGNSCSYTPNSFGGAQPQYWGNTSSDYTQTGHTGPVHFGSGVPSNTMGVNGNTYHRTDTPGTANQRQYVKSAGVWVGVV